MRCRWVGGAAISGEPLPVRQVAIEKPGEVLSSAAYEQDAAAETGRGGALGLLDRQRLGEAPGGGIF